jgi:hypothetical protein
MNITYLNKILSVDRLLLGEKVFAKRFFKERLSP